MGDGAANQSREERQIVDLYADEGGIGDALPVVFLHSCAGNGSQWSAQLEHLRAERRAIALDWRGHGHSGVPANGDYSFLTMADDVDEAVGRLGIERFVLVGHSAGGLVALQYVADHPECVAGLLLVDPAGDARQLPSEQTESLLAGLDSDAYRDTIGGYLAFPAHGLGSHGMGARLGGSRSDPERDRRGDLSGSVGVRSPSRVAVLPWAEALGHHPIERRAVQPAQPCCQIAARDGHGNRSLVAHGQTSGVQRHPGRVPRASGEGGVIRPLPLAGRMKPPQVLMDEELI